MILWRWYVAKLLDRLLPRACWFDLGTWAHALIRWRDIKWTCTDAEDSGRGVCWCGKMCTKAIEHGAAYYHPETGEFTWKDQVQE